MRVAISCGAGVLVTAIVLLMVMGALQVLGVSLGSSWSLMVGFCAGVMGLLAGIGCRAWLD